MWQSRAFLRGFSKRLWESVLFTDFHQTWHFPQPLTRVVFGRSQRTPIFEMGKIRRKFEPEFKRQMVEQVETGQITMAQAAREYQISRSLIERWRKQYRSNVSALADQPSRQERQLEAENEKLKAKIGDLVMQIEHLKKLQVWVRQRKSANTSAITSNNLDQFRKRAK